MLKVIQVKANFNTKDFDINNLLKSAGVKRIHKGWYSLWYNGIIPDCSNVIKAKRNKKGKFLDVP